jgi:hypothetical protein
MCNRCVATSNNNNEEVVSSSSSSNNEEVVSSSSNNEEVLAERHCAYCDEVFEGESHATVDGEVCNDCNDNYYDCESCSARHLVNDLNGVRVTNSTGIVEESQWCDVCVRSSAFICDCCSSIIPERDGVALPNGRMICMACYDGVYFTCDSCGDVFHTDDYGSDGCCVGCNNDSEVDEEEENNYKKIKKYHSGKENVKYIGKYKALSPYLGSEIEVESTSGDNEKLAELCGDLLDNFRVEADGSLSNGFEIISHALTYKEHLKLENTYRALFKTLSDNGGRSHDTTTCGLHVHISNEFLNDNQRRFIVDFFLENKTYIEKFSRRKDSGYSAFNDYDSSKRNRYSAVNLTNKKTIEFRCFKGTLNFDTYFATLQFVLCVYLFSKSRSKNNKWSTFLEFTERKGKNFKILKDYLKIRNLV